jgi:hypothetical protein
MHYAISYHLAQARITGLRHRAQRDTLARAARSPGRRGTPQPMTYATRMKGNHDG